MIDEILNMPSFPSSFSIVDEKEKYINYGGTLPEYFEDIDELSKDEVIEIIRDERQSLKEEFLAILFWGKYFEVITTTGTIKSLVRFVESGAFDGLMKNRRDTIIESDSPQTLFQSFSKKCKIPGLDYAYFTKLFFFYRVALAPKKQTFLILDKWLSRAWCAIDGTMNENTHVFDTYYKAPTYPWFEGTLKRRKPEAYERYLRFMDSLNQKYENAGGLIKLEEKLFGADLRQYKEFNDYNPRVLYREWARNQCITLKDPKPKSKDKKSTKKNFVKEDRSGELLSSFYLNTEPATYIGLTVHPHKKKKEGYIDIKGWLCVSEHLKSLLEPYKLKWREGNTIGGSKEKYMTKFETQKAGIEFLRDKKMIED